jgi:hypothetical protein
MEIEQGKHLAGVIAANRRNDSAYLWVLKAVVQIGGAVFGAVRHPAVLVERVSGQNSLKTQRLNLPDTCLNTVRKGTGPSPGWADYRNRIAWY